MAVNMNYHQHYIERSGILKKLFKIAIIGKWITTSFKSCSTDRSEAGIFKSGPNSHMLCIQTAKTGKIPFIDVNDVLKSGHTYDDEKEILLPPFLPMLIDEKTLNSPNTSDDYIMTASSEIIDPNKRTQIPTYDLDEHDISDEELDMIIELKIKPSKTPEEILQLDTLLNKMHTYIMTRCASWKSMFIGNPIIEEQPTDQITISPAQALKNALRTGITPTNVNEANNIESIEQNLEENNGEVTKDD